MLTKMLIPETTTTRPVSTSVTTMYMTEVTPSDHIIARIQTAIDWDKSPPEGAEGTDFEHTLTIGYRF